MNEPHDIDAHVGPGPGADAVTTDRAVTGGPESDSAPTDGGAVDSTGGEVPDLAAAGGRDIAARDIAAAVEHPAGQDSADGDALGGGSADGEDTSLTAVAQDRVLPDVSEYDTLVSALESMLLVVDAPVGEETLAGALEQPVDRVTETLRTMAEDYTDRGSGFDLRRSAEGWRFYTRDTYAPFVEKLLLDGQRSKLTRAALETLAVIAYRQPVTRSRVAAVRGVNVDGVIRTLVQRGLIEESGADGESGGTLYVTTELFLERLGLESLNDLPPIAPLLPEVDSIDDI
ncbi:segregation and condensation protein B [Prauserella isguenensis]|uniref:Segregation and condensation protein B n=1 Tax=Prauserella isguenensis TaxID=1470180 RepID=A0A839S5D6_9PSEU|nr:segregation and condensation protein B [Prauserella isguenensis]